MRRGTHDIYVYNSNNLLNVHMRCIALLSLAEITLEESFGITGQRIEALSEPNLIAAAFSNILATPALDVPLGLDVFVVAENISRRLVIGKIGWLFIKEDDPDVNTHSPKHLADGGKGQAGGLDD